MAKLLSVKVTDEDLKLLDLLGEQTSRSRSDVVRHLIKLSRLTGKLDIIVAEEDRVPCDVSSVVDSI
jgi:ribbon-helix-helix CopG family protein